MSFGFAAALLVCFAAGSLGAQEPSNPSVTLANRSLTLRVYLPDAKNGFYQGTRFDWSGVIGELTFAGHRFYGPWFARSESGIHDFEYQGPEDEVVAGPASAMTGPAEEFQGMDGTTLGFRAAQPGKTFVKIGVGVLRRPDAAPYDVYRAYEIVDHGSWRVESRKDRIVFTQRVNDGSSGYGYVYTKTLRLEKDDPELVIEHKLTNIGRMPMDARVYDHNFLTLDGLPPGPDFVITLPFPVATREPVNGDLGAVEGTSIRYRKELRGRDVFRAAITGFGPSASDYRIRVENTRLGAGYEVTGDRPLIDEALWSIRTTLSVEPFVHVAAEPNASFTWTYRYRYFAGPAGAGTRPAQ